MEQRAIDNPTQGKACKAHVQSRTTWCHCKTVVIPKHGHGHRAAMLHFSYTCACCRQGLHDELPLGLGHGAFLHGLASWMGGMQQHILLSSCLLVWFHSPFSFSHSCSVSLGVFASDPKSASVNVLSLCPVCVSLPFVIHSLPLSLFLSPLNPRSMCMGSWSHAAKGMCRSRAHSAASGLSHNCYLTSASERMQWGRSCFERVGCKRRPMVYHMQYYSICSKA